MKKLTGLFLAVAAVLFFSGEAIAKSRCRNLPTTAWTGRQMCPRDALAWYIANSKELAKEGTFLGYSIRVRDVFTKIPNAQEDLLVSALIKKHVQEILEVFKGHGDKQPWSFHESYLTLLLFYEEKGFPSGVRSVELENMLQQKYEEAAMEIAAAIKWKGKKEKEFLLKRLEELIRKKPSLEKEWGHLLK